MTKTCSVCHAEFECGADQAAGGCWCAALPAIMPLDLDQDCRCRPCLIQAILERIELGVKLKGVAEMVELARPYRDQAELIEGLDYTIEDGNTVFTSWYHLKRGTCCENDCRNCPYGTG
jgi:hypothetical protein